jgi:hypothetical protein
MEKQGMVCGRKIYRTGLLIMKTKLIFRVTLIILFLFSHFFLHAQEDTDTDEEEIEEDPGPEVTTSVEPETPLTGRTMTISLIIDYPVPEEVNVIAPPFTDSLILDRIVKAPRVTETQVFTVVEYRLIPVKSGRIVLDSFTVVCPAGITESDSLSFNIRGEGEEAVILTPRLAWEGVPRQIAVRDRVTLVLRVNGWNSPQPAPEFFMPPVPQGVIIALLPLSEQERAGGIAVKLTLIPLTPGNFRLNSRIIRHENVVFSIPAMNIQITGSSAVQPPLPEEDIHISESVNVTASFPDFILTAPDKSPIRETQRLQCKDIYDRAKNLWDSGLFAKSLAELRRSERDHPSGALLQPIRRQAEENLGIFNTEDESRQRRKTLSVFFSFILFFVIIAPFVCLFLIKKRNSLLIKRVLLCAVIFSAAFSFFFYRLSDSRFIFHGKGNLLGVTKKTPVRRMADIEGEGVFNFREGQPVIILLNSGSWVYIRANDASDLSGWIPAEEAEFY